MQGKENYKKKLQKYKKNKKNYFLTNFKWCFQKGALLLDWSTFSLKKLQKIKNK